MMDLRYLHVASLVFDCPVCLQEQKLKGIIEGLSPRFLGEGKAAKPQAGLEYETGEEAERRPYRVTADGIALIPIMGTLVKRGSFMSASSGLTGYNRLQGQLEDAATDPKVKGIILDVDSCGGQVNGLFDLVDLVRAARENKPVWAVADDDCYSAAYALASAAEKIFVTRTGGVGSVGVLAVHLDETQANALQGIAYTFFRSGEYKAEGSADEPLSDHAAQVLQKRVDEMGLLLAQTVGRNRGMTAQAVLDLKAGVCFGQHGIEVGLADQVGTLEQAHDELAAALKPVMAGLGLWRAESVPGQGKAKKDLALVARTLSAADTVLRGDAALHSQEDDMTLKNTAASAPETPLETKSTEPPPADKLVSLDQARAEGEKSGEEKFRAYAGEITELCALAGFEDKAGAFIEKKVSVGEVRRALLEARVQREEAAGVLVPQSLAASGGRVGATFNLPEYYRKLNARTLRPGAVL